MLTDMVDNPKGCFKVEYIEEEALTVLPASTGPEREEAKN